jgi:hypothetical protein
MAIQTINVGNIVNDGLGDDLRTAFQKVNANFAELSTTSTTTASNVGSAGLGIFKRKNGADLEFRKLVAGVKTQLTEGADTVIINSTQPDAFTRILTDQGIASADFNTSITVQGGTNIDVTANGSVITVGETINTVALISAVDFGPINGLYENAIQFILAGGDYDFGTFEQPSTFSYDAGEI